jgi:hypothetical protein
LVAEVRGGSGLKPQLLEVESASRAKASGSQMLLNDPDRAQLGLEHGPEGLANESRVSPSSYRVALIRSPMSCSRQRELGLPLRAAYPCVKY